MTAQLEHDIKTASERKDAAALVELFSQAADLCEARGDTNAGCFFLTQAYVFALEIGAPQAADLNGRLAAHGREDYQPDLKDIP